MNLLQVVAFALVAALLALFVKEQKPLFASLIVLFAGIVLMLVILKQLTVLVSYISQMAGQTSIPTTTIKLILKMVGISYLTEFTAQIIRDTGQESLAQKIEFFAKLILLYLALPIVVEVMRKLMELFPG